MFWEKDAETMSRAKIRQLQLERLKWTINRCYNNVPYYKDMLDKAGVTPDMIKTLDDIRRLPLTTKEELRKNYPFGLFASPKEDIVEIHTSSGTTGKPIVGGYTKNDLELWGNCMARLVVAAGARREDIAQISFGYGLFTGAFGLHYALQKVGCMVVPISSGNSERQIMIMEDFGTTVLVATPSYAVYLSELAKDMGVADKLKLRLGLFGSEMCTPEMRAQIEKNIGIIVTDNYGLTELGGCGVSGECEERQGLHINEDHFYPEIIDPDTGEVLPEGEEGELVITPLSKEAFPIFRYRTKDITRLYSNPCKCGRTLIRMDKVVGRTDDMLIIKGVNVFPSQIESVIFTMPHIGPHYQLVLRKERFMDSLEVQVELIDGSLLEQYSKLEALQHRIREKLRSVLGIDCGVTLVAPRTITRFEGKAKRIVDLRNS
ncbi:MAG: phenylacetate--CoA ligase [Clostridiales bacterium]|jgi:phenylacetate-CoA ligase|nr:phenylacetate--CoA ligase [Clostridiales bacterium]